MTARASGTARALLRVLLPALVVAAWTAAPAVELSAQEAVTLERVEELARLGRTEEAREGLLAWWREGRSEASRRDLQRGLWLRGRLTVDPAQAELDFRRLVVEYPGGAFSDRALLRLAQGAWARGDGEVAERHLDQLQRDYPGSSVAREAREWRSAAGPLPAPPEPVARPEESVPAAGESLPAEGAEATFAVQLGAFAGGGRARALADRSAAAGYQARIVQVEGSRLLHVRVGRFVREAEARVLLEDIRAAGLTAALVRDANREEEGP